MWFGLTFASLTQLSLLSSLQVSTYDLSQSAKYIIVGYSLSLDSVAYWHKPVPK